MTSLLKTKIKVGIFAGILTSGLLTAFYYLIDCDFSWIRTINHFLMMSIIFGFLVKDKKTETP
jgi:hypothetical protein